MTSRTMVGEERGDLHVHFICRISPDHMLYHEVAAGMLVLPRIESQHRVLVDDDVVAFGDEAFDLSGSEGGGGHAVRFNECMKV